jgi:ABC-type branched-subunit amino acid transport system ATPase component
LGLFQWATILLIEHDVKLVMSTPAPAIASGETQ